MKLTKLSKPSSETVLKVSQSFLMVLAAIGFFAAVHPEVRANVRGTLRSDYRTVVSTAKGDLSGTGTLYTVAKVKTRDNIYLEIFETIMEQNEVGQAASATQRLVERIEIPEARDAFFSFNGQATNLAIDDVNGDGRPEILVPTFDRNLVGRLNVIEYDNDTQGFTKVVR
jgi:hypothetical protein